MPQLPLLLELKRFVANALFVLVEEYAHVVGMVVLDAEMSSLLSFHMNQCESGR